MMLQQKVETRASRQMPRLKGALEPAPCAALQSAFGTDFEKPSPAFIIVARAFD
jgi:hypothetical protein